MRWTDRVLVTKGKPLLRQRFCGRPNARRGDIILHRAGISHNENTFYSTPMLSILLVCLLHCLLYLRIALWKWIQCGENYYLQPGQNHFVEYKVQCFPLNSCGGEVQSNTRWKYSNPACAFHHWDSLASSNQQLGPSEPWRDCMRWVTLVSM